ncbi:hypothetical protein O1611_g2001 [Lasiodiplodia mahajangana]|uniref:Uncharacterized protein n=1 Tax=Lasiodiplodia mahajangana TaxID=1108764 RepID=A0ACC2JWD5_9PEZI|nr:hypothetical protein O1611_g2001 [Lasiodiplodia mahajangana]
MSNGGMTHISTSAALDNVVPRRMRGSVRRWKEATEKVYIGEEEAGERIRWVIREMVMGNVEYVRGYLESSSESDIFLHGLDAYSRDRGIEDDSFINLDDADWEDIGGTGDTALHWAACEMYPEIIKVLLERGANPNVWNFSDRTPLAEAALWGRWDNVKILLENGADKNLDREAIVRLLGDSTEALDTENYVPSGYSFTKIPGQEARLMLLAHFEISSEQKTVAVLYRGGRFDPISAMSGWGHQANDNMNIQIAGRDWTSDVLRICKIVKYKLPFDNRDQGVAGQYYACHAEKQLVAYFIHKHCFLEQEIDAGSSLDYNIGAKRHQKKLLKLRSYEPPSRLKTATIMANNTACGNCQHFVNHINRVLGLQINLK